MSSQRERDARIEVPAGRRTTRPPLSTESERNRQQWVDDVLQQALRSYDGVVPPEVLAFIRDLQGIELMCHPDGRELVRQGLGETELGRLDEPSQEHRPIGEKGKVKARSGRSRRSS